MRGKGAFSGWSDCSRRVGASREPRARGAPGFTIEPGTFGVGSLHRKDIVSPPLSATETGASARGRGSVGARRHRRRDVSRGGRLRQVSNDMTKSARGDLGVRRSSGGCSARGAAAPHRGPMGEHESFG